jgi:hypothetical protein
MGPEHERAQAFNAQVRIAMDTIQLLLITGAVGHPIGQARWDIMDTLEVMPATERSEKVMALSQLHQSLPQARAIELLSVVKEQTRSPARQLPARIEQRTWVGYEHGVFWPDGNSETSSTRASSRQF